MTSFLLRTEGNEVVLTTIHHNGTNFMPIHEGIVVPHDLGYLKDVSRILTQMGDRNEFGFPLKKCEIYGPRQMSCSQGSPVILNGQEMRGFFLSTSTVKEATLGKVFENTKITLSLQIKNFVPVQDIVMNFQPNECEMSF